MKRTSRQTFEAFCREAVDFLKSSATPYLMIGGIAVGAIGEPRMTGDVDVIGYLGMDKALALIDTALAAGFRIAPDERARLQATGTLRFKKGQFELDIILASLPFELRVTVDRPHRVEVVVVDRAQDEPIGGHDHRRERIRTGRPPPLVSRIRRVARRPFAPDGGLRRRDPRTSCDVVCGCCCHATPARCAARAGSSWHPAPREVDATVGARQPVAQAARRTCVRAGSALVVSLAVHAGVLIVAVRSSARGGSAQGRLPVHPVSATPRVEVAAVPALIEVEVLDEPRRWHAAGPPAPGVMAGRDGRGAAITTGTADAVRPGEAAGGRPGASHWFTMRGPDRPDLRLGPEAIDRSMRGGGRGPERVARSGRLESAGGGRGVIHDAVTDVTVDRDGTVHLHDKDDVDWHWDIHLPTPDRIKDGLAQAGRDVATWYGDPYARARVGPSQDVPRDAAATPGACDHWGDLCNIDLAQRYDEVSALQRTAGLSIAHGKLDVTALLMRKLGVGDAYAARKLKLLDDTRDERAALGAQHRAEDLARSAEIMQRNLQTVWRATEDPEERREALFALWDECTEGDGPVGEAGERARKMVIGWIRAKLPAGSPGAFTPDDVARRSAQRRSTQPFVPYE